MKKLETKLQMPLRTRKWELTQLNVKFTELINLQRVDNKFICYTKKYHGTFSPGKSKKKGKQTRQ